MKLMFSSRSKIVAVCLAAAVVLGGCGGGATTTEGGGAIEESALAEAKDRVEEGMKSPDQFPLTVPLVEKPKAGQTLGFIYRPGPAGELFLENFKEAAELLGLKVRAFSTGKTADEFESAFSSADASDLAGVWVAGQDPKTWPKYATKWSNEGLPVANHGNDWPSEGKKFNWVPSNESGMYTILSDWVIADANGKKPGVLFVTLPFLPAYDRAADEQIKRVKELCDDCKAERLDVALTEMGSSAVPSRVSGYLLKNPDTKYVVFDAGDTATGVVAALRSSGIKGVKIAVAGGSEAQQSDLAKGDISAILAFDLGAGSWVATDWFARVLTGQDPSVNYEFRMPRRLLTADNVSEIDVSVPYQVFDDEPERWSKFWGLDNR